MLAYLQMIEIVLLERQAYNLSIILNKKKELHVQILLICVSSNVVVNMNTSNHRSDASSTMLR